jgi:nitrite reductase/ring-hydroxylating ferredoxin subunit
VLHAARPVTVAERIERAPCLDRPVSAVADAVVRALPPGRGADALHGVPFGQPVHPALVQATVQATVGCWTSSVLLDLLGGPGTERAAATLAAAGVAAAVPAAATGLADWSALHPYQQRVGLVHAVSQASATLLFTGSLLARAAGLPGAGRALSASGLFAATVGAYLGGHLALRLGAGASHAEPIDHLAVLGWHDLCPLADLPPGRPVRRQLGYLSVLAIRAGDAVHVLADRCAHLGGPLHQGRVTRGGGVACVTCPWHESVFRLSDGAVLHGPATARQPAFETRVTDAGQVQVRPRDPVPGQPWWSAPAAQRKRSRLARLPGYSGSRVMLPLPSGPGSAAGGSLAATDR